jgi:hypothetical protein
MNENFGLLDDLNDDTTPRQNPTDVLRDRWMSALESDDLDVIHHVSNDISRAQSMIRQELQVYRYVPSQRKGYQTEEWLGRAIRASHFHDQMFRTLESHRRRVSLQNAQKKLSDLERLKFERLSRQEGFRELVIRKEIIQARAKVATLRYELRRTQSHDRRFINLIKHLGLLDGHDVGALWNQVRDMPPTEPEKRAMSDLKRWVDKLEHAKQRLMEVQAGNGDAKETAEDR